MNLEGKMFAGILLLSVFTGAYLGEILRGGVESIPRTQLESARAVGFSRFQVYRYVIFPQALRRVLPAMAGLFVSLVKDSSLLNVIGVNEFTYHARASTPRPISAGSLPAAGARLPGPHPADRGLSHWLERRFKAATALIFRTPT